MSTNAIPQMFAAVAAQLEDLHAIAVERQRTDNASDMQSVLNIHLRDGLAALDGKMRDMEPALGDHLP